MSKADWADASVPTMWTSAQAADTETAWQQVSAWQRTYDLLLHHELRLEACRDELTFAWPPDRSPAATAFVEYIDGMLASIRRAKDQAAENHKALAGILASLAATRADMEKLKAEWDKREAEDVNRAYNLSNILPHSAGANWQEALNDKARTRMAKNDQEVLEARLKFVDLTPPNGGGVGGPIKPQDGRGSPADQTEFADGPATRRSSSGQWLTPPFVALPAEIGGSAGLAGSASGPRLAESGPAEATTSKVTAEPGPRSIGMAAPGLSPVSLVRPASSTGAGLNSAIGAAGGVGNLIPTGRSPKLGVATEPIRTLAPQKVSPVGGVIENTGTIRSGTMGMPLTAGAIGARQNESGPKPPTILQWDVAEGVAPVIEPASEPVFVLGPGIIGVDQ